jgi:hypothetical protein
MAKRPNLGNYVAPWEYDRHIARLYRDMELDMINSMKRNLAGHRGEEIKVGTDFTAWQAAKLRELKRYQAKNKRMMTGYTDGMYQQLGQTLREEFRQGIIGEKSRYAQAKGIDALQGTFFTIDDRKVNALIGELNGSMRADNSAALRKCNDVYRQVIFDTTLFASNGVLTEKQAFDRAMQKFTERGIDCIVYSNGAKVNIADYSQMAIRTAHLRANLMGAGEMRQQLGEHLIQITKHGTSCPLCKPWETKILIDDVYSGGKAGEAAYPMLSEAMKAGLYHPNCRHGCGTYYPELDEVAQEVFGDNAKEKAGVAHAESQVQKFKRLAAGCLEPKLKAKYDARLGEWEGILKSSQERLTSVSGSGRIQAGGAVASAQSATPASPFFPAKTRKEANDFATGTLGVPLADYSGCDLETANAWNQGLADNFSRFPELKKRFGFVGECHERNALMRDKYFQDKMADLRRANPGRTDAVLEPYAKKQTDTFMRSLAVSKDTMAQSAPWDTPPWDFLRGVTVNREHGKNAATFKASLTRNVQSQFHPMGCDSIRSVLDHEIGHQLDSLLDIQADPSVRNLFDSRTQADLTKDISRYSWDNANQARYSEMIAEAWAEYCNNPNPRPIAQHIGQLVESKYKLMFGGITP